MTRPYRHRAALIAGPVAIVLLLTACQAAGSSPSAAAPSASAAAPSEAESMEPSEAPAESMAPPGDATVVVASAASVGDYLTDADGNTLYVFLNDSPGETSCFDTCLQNWPALTVEGSPTAGDGVTGELGTIERSDDGSSQVTLDGWPLYYFAADSAPGDTNGEGIGDVWFVARPDGSVPSAAASTGLYGY